MKKVCIIGHFGGNKDFFDGQTIKTKIVAEALSGRFGNEDIVKIDTVGGRKSIIRIFYQSMIGIARCSNIVLMPASNGIRFFSMLLSVFNVCFRRKIHYVVIGGWLPDLLESNRKLLRNVKKFYGIYVETQMMKDKLQELGLENVLVMPNCKKLDIADSSEFEHKNGEALKLCTFSRVSKEKGIEDAVKAVTYINEKYQKVVCKLDIYGQIDSEQVKWFHALKEEFHDYIQYMGIVPYDKTTEVLGKYYLLLFPTYYEGEGFAGTLIDALAAGVPVIASDWKYNIEIVKPFKTGVIYDLNQKDALAAVLESACLNTELWIGMRNLCISEAYQYTPETALSALMDNINCEKN